MNLTKLVTSLITLIAIAATTVSWFLSREIDTRNSVELVMPEQITKKRKETQLPAVITTGLKIPWDIGFLPDGSLLVTERPGNLLTIAPDGSRQNINIPRVVYRGEGGLLGLTLHPDFEKNRFVYLYMTVKENLLGTRNTIIRYQFDGKALTDETVIIDGIPGAIYHDGGRMEFGPDGLLYITTGDATSPDISQDRNSLGGKILRVRDDGSIPSHNPFGTAIYSYGHRNPQGIAWDNDGRLWQTEHGRSGLRSGFDEINLIVRGANYGWPNIEGDATREKMISPAAHSGATNTWAPASALFWDDSLFFGGLKGEALYEAALSGETVSEVRVHFKEQYGRIRTVRLGPDGMFYLTTSNTDGRGNVKTGDDKIIRIDPHTFRQ